MGTVAAPARRGGEAPPPWLPLTTPPSNRRRPPASRPPSSVLCLAASRLRGSRPGGGRPGRGAVPRPRPLVPSPPHALVPSSTRPLVPSPFSSLPSTSPPHWARDTIPCAPPPAPASQRRRLARDRPSRRRLLPSPCAMPPAITPSAATQPVDPLPLSQPRRLQPQHVALCRGTALCGRCLRLHLQLAAAASASSAQRRSASRSDRPSASSTARPSAAAALGLVGATPQRVALRAPPALPRAPQRGPPRPPPPPPRRGATPQRVALRPISHSHYRDVASPNTSPSAAARPFAAGLRLLPQLAAAAADELREKILFVVHPRPRRDAASAS